MIYFYKTIYFSSLDTFLESFVAIDSYASLIDLVLPLASVTVDLDFLFSQSRHP